MVADAAGRRARAHGEARDRRGAGDAALDTGRDQPTRLDGGRPQASTGDGTRTSARAGRLLQGATGAADRTSPPRVLLLRRQPARACAARERRGHLERAQLEPLLAAAVRPRRLERLGARVRAAARRMLGCPARRPAGRERDRCERAPWQRRPDGEPTLAIAGRLLFGTRRRLPGQRPRPADLRHDRPQPVPEHVGRAALGTPRGRDDRRGRLRQARRGTENRIRGHGPARARAAG